MSGYERRFGPFFSCSSLLLKCACYVAKVTFFEQGDWDTEEGRCSVAVSMETKFSRKTMWRKAIESGSKSANVKGMRDLMQMVRSNTGLCRKIQFAPRTRRSNKE